MVDQEPVLNNDLKWIMKYFEEKFSQRDENRELQAKEYERRLNGLNHENERIVTAQEKSVSAERFEGIVGQIYQKLDNTALELRKDIVDLKEFKQKQEGKGQGGKDIMDIIKLVIIIAGFFIAYFVIKK